MKKAIAFIGVFAALAVCAYWWSMQDTPEQPAGMAFHKQTRLTIGSVLQSLIVAQRGESVEKKTHAGETVSLPQPDFSGITVEKALRMRRSVRSYSNQPLSMGELSQLFFAAQGITGKEQGITLRAAPSAGALYPCELYAAVFRVDGLDPGLYRYVPEGHSLVLVNGEVKESALTAAALGQEMVGDAAVTFIITGVFQRCTGKYGQRGYRYVYMEAGHTSQNLYLQAASLGLGSVCVGAFFDENLNQLLGVDGEREAALYLHAVGAQ